MKVDALFFQDNKLIWSFPEQLEDLSIDMLAFVKALQEFGSQHFGEGVTTIRMVKQRTEEEIWEKGNELFIVNLSNRFFLIINNIIVTARRLELVTDDIPKDIIDNARAVLIGQGITIYANLLEASKSSVEELEISALFRRILLFIEVKEDIELIVSGRRCSLSPLSLTELLLFHYYLRKFLTHTSVAKRIPGWALCYHMTGNEIFLDFQAPASVLLSGFLSAITSFAQSEFNEIPEKIVFGIQDAEIINLRFFSGQNKEILLAISQPSQILSDLDFEKEFIQLTPEIKEDLDPVLRRYIRKQIARSLITSIDDANYQDLAALYYRTSHNRLFPEARILELGDLGSMTKRRLVSLKKRGVLTVPDLINHEWKKRIPQWFKVVKREAENLYEITGGWVLSWKDDGSIS